MDITLECIRDPRQSSSCPLISRAGRPPLGGPHVSLNVCGLSSGWSFSVVFFFRPFFFFLYYYTYTYIYIFFYFGDASVRGIRGTL